jgi:hypothetical protein
MERKEEYERKRPHSPIEDFLKVRMGVITAEQRLSPFNAAGKGLGFNLHYTDTVFFRIVTASQSSYFITTGAEKKDGSCREAKDMKQLKK